METIQSIIKHIMKKEIISNTESLKFIYLGPLHMPAFSKHKNL